MARSDELVDHDGKTCGQCHYTMLGAEVAREMIEAGEYEDVVSKWAAEHKRRPRRGLACPTMRRSNERPRLGMSSFS